LSGLNGENFFINKSLDLFSSKFFVFSENLVKFVKSKGSSNYSLLFSSQLGSVMFQLFSLSVQIILNVEVVKQVSKGSGLDDLRGSLSAEFNLFGSYKLIIFTFISAVQIVQFSFDQIVKAGKQIFIRFLGRSNQVSFAIRLSSSGNVVLIEQESEFMDSRLDLVQQFCIFFFIL